MQEAEHAERFCRWISEHQGLLFRVVHASANDPQDKNDLFQEILLQLWRSMPAFQGRCRETTWMYRVALNTAVAWQRAEKRRRARDKQIAMFADPPGSDDDPDPRVEQLYEAIRRMPRAEASLLLLHLDGLSYQDMSEVLGVSENCLGVRLTRARKRLAIQMKGTDHEL